MKPLLVCVYSQTEGVQRFIASMENLQESVEGLLLELDVYCGHVKRFQYVLEAIKDQPDDRLIVFTDVADVIFQVPMEFCGKYDIYVASEYCKWRNNEWWQQFRGTDIGETIAGLDDYKVLNGGCFAMKAGIFNDYINYLLDNESDNPFKDQILLNDFVYNFDYKYKISDNFGCLTDGIDVGKIMQNGAVFVWKRTNTIIPVVHANGGKYKHLL